MIEFTPWPKTARLYRPVIVTEKIDGTNAAIHIVDPATVEGGSLLGDGEVSPDGTAICVNLAGDSGWRPVLVAAQSRKRMISPEKNKDNAGFARWVRDHATSLAEGLGEGLHFGEWYGSGIQRGYGLEKGEKRFMLFNTTRWAEHREDLWEWFGSSVEVATVLYEGTFDQYVIDNHVHDLREDGSVHVPGWPKAEGVIVHHVASGINYKVLCENDELPKGIVARAERENMEALRNG